jgi:F-type H+-transporting ATPase subunit epsilon
MAGMFKFELVSPERVLISTEAEEVLIPGVEGDFTVLVGHAPVISLLRPGVVHAKTEASTPTRIFVHNGFCEVTPTSVTVLAEKADDVATLTAKDVEGHIATAREILEDKYATDEQRHAAHHAIEHLNSLNGLPD